MKLKEFDLILDIRKHIKQDYIEVVQGDFNTNILNIQLYDGLDIFQLSGLSVEIAFSKPDGTTVLQDSGNGVIVAGNKIICALLTNTIAANGSVIAEVRISEGTNLLTSARFDFYVRKSIVNDETIISTNEFPILTQLINEVRQIEAQVPEEVLSNLNSLTNYVNVVNDTLIAHKAESAKDDVHDLKKDGVILTASEQQSIPHNQETLRVWSLVNAYKSPASDFFNITNPSRITINSNRIKKVRLIASILWAYTNNGIGMRGIRLLKNGVEFTGGNMSNQQALPSGETNYQFLKSAIIDVVQGDYFEVIISQTSGVAQDIGHGSGGKYGGWFELEVIE